MSYDYQSSLPAFKELGKDRCREIVFKAICTIGICNDRELADYLNWPINRITPRRGELVQLGFIMQEKKQADPETGRKVSYWTQSKNN
jgi:hypothetical protein